MGNKCCICGRGIHVMNTYHRAFGGKSFDLCMFCIDALEKIDSGKPEKVVSGAKHLRSELGKGVATPDAALMVKEALKDIPDDELNAEITASSFSPESKPSALSSTGTALAGFVFLILAIVLYFMSVNNDYGVANIQSTVYSAASFVAAVVCFATARIINAVNSK